MVWTPLLKPLGVYHVQAGGGRTACGIAALETGGGYRIGVGEALALGDVPCGRCFGASVHSGRAPVGRHHRATGGNS